MSKARQPITEERRQIYLSVLSKTGSVHAAAKAATPWAQGVHGGAESFRDLAKRDPEFAAQAEAAKSAALGSVEELIADHAINGIEKSVWHRGERVGSEIVHDHTLLLRLAARLDPAWAVQRKVDSSVEVTNQSGDNAMLTLTVNDLLLLDEHEQDSLIALVTKIDGLKHEGSTDVRN